MTRVRDDGKVEVVFTQHMSCSSRPDLELVFTLEQFLLLADEAGSMEQFRCKLYDEGERRAVTADWTKYREGRKVAYKARAAGGGK